MIALDTNVLARFLLRDDAAQYREARSLLEREAECWIPVTVILELAWVLKTAGVPRAEVAQKLRGLLALANVRPHLPEAVHAALRWAEKGLDLADALHLALSSRSTEFYSFDAALARRAAELGATPAVSVP
jgi:predicted nucleic acid-binding protein